MSFKSLRRAPRASNDVEKEHLNYNPNNSNSKENELQIMSLSSPFKLPDGWFVEERRRPGNPSHVDRYYYEPGTRRKFRSLISVQRYLIEDTGDYLTTERMISENEDTTYIEFETGQRTRSMRSFERSSTGENACRATPKSVVKSSTGKRSARGVRSCQNPVEKHFSDAEDKITPKALKHSVQSKHSEKADSQKKMNLGEDDRGSIHNLPRPPAKVSWVLSGPGGFWSPLVDDSTVPDSEKLKWSEAFVQSIHEGIINGQWS